MYSIIVLLLNVQLVLALDINLRTNQVVELQGYRAVEYNLTTTDGYILSLVEVINPQLDEEDTLDRDPILFLHGSLTTANFFIALAKKPKPRNLVQAIGPNASLETLKQLLQNDPASKSLAYTASNMGHPVWLLNRRGTQFSLAHKDPRRQAFFRMANSSEMLDDSRPTDQIDPTLDIGKFLSRLLVASSDFYNPKYWNFSLDEQAKYDVPEAIDFVLEKTGRKKLAVLGHSAGSALTLMSLSLYPSLANKISKAILWAPALYLGHARLTPLLQANRVTIMKALALLLGPDIPPVISLLIKQLAMDTCNTSIGRNHICPSIYARYFGPQGTQQNLIEYNNQRPYITGLLPDINSAREISQLFHSIVYGQMYKFDYQSKKANLAAYGQEFPPIYNVSRIPSKNIYLWSGSQDTLVSPIDIELVARDINLPEKHFTTIEAPGLLFNHLAYGTHKDLPQLLILPSLCQIENRPGI